MKSIGATSLLGLMFVSFFALIACSKERASTGFATAEPECRGVFWLQPPGYALPEEPPPIHWREFTQAKIDAWSSNNTHAAALQRLGQKQGGAPPGSMKLHVKPQPGTLLLNVWCTGGTLLQRHDFLKAAMEAFIETHGFDPRWEPWDKLIAEVNLSDDAIRGLREEITSARKKSPPDEAAEKALREKLDAAKIQLQEKRQALQTAPPITSSMRTLSIIILSPPAETLSQELTVTRAPGAPLRA